MKKIIFLVLVLFILGCEIEDVDVNEPITIASIDSVSLSLDKDLYHSGEIIHMGATINSEVALENVSIRFYGIEASRYRLDITEITDLKLGENTVVFDYKAPSCYGCAGIRPGTYQISADVIYDEEVLSTSTVDIEIRQ